MNELAMKELAMDEFAINELIMNKLAMNKLAMRKIAMKINLIKNKYRTHRWPTRPSFILFGLMLLIFFFISFIILIQNHLTGDLWNFEAPSISHIRKGKSWEKWEAMNMDLQQVPIYIAKQNLINGEYVYEY